MTPGECTMITEEFAIDWKRAKEHLAKRGAPTGGWKGGILLINLTKDSNGGIASSKKGEMWWGNIGEAK